MSFWDSERCMYDSESATEFRASPEKNTELCQWESLGQPIAASFDLVRVGPLLLKAMLWKFQQKMEKSLYLVQTC